MEQTLRTSDVAQAVGVHPNTVRLYEAKGYLSPVPRSGTGYRLFAPLHVEQMRLAHLALNRPLPGIQPMMVNLVKRAADGDLDTAMALAHDFLAYVRMEQARAEAAVEFLENWVNGQQPSGPAQTLRIGRAADYLGVTGDQLRNWDRSGLLNVPRDPETGYRVYGVSEIGRLRVIRLLRQSGYSLMAILRMLRQFDAGKTKGLREALDTPGDNEAVETVADRWLTTLAQQEQRAQAIIRQVAEMIEAAY